MDPTSQVPLGVPDRTSRASQISAARRRQTLVPLGAGAGCTVRAMELKGIG